MGTKGQKMLGVECVECGDMRTGVAKAGLDEDGHRIRSRKCRQCSHSFTTVEIPLAFNFNGMNVTKKESEHARYVERHEGAVEELHPRRYPDVFNITERVNAAGELEVLIRLVKGRLSDRCRKGLHWLRGDNVSFDTQGKRHCRACTNAYNREYRRQHPEYVKMMRREQRRALRERKKNERALTSVA